MLALGTLLGKIGREGGVPKADVLGGVIKGVAQVARTSFFHVRIRQERVMFLTVYDYAVIWSRNGEKPAFLTSPDEEGKLFSCRLSFSPTDGINVYES